MNTIYQIMDWLLPFECFQFSFMKNALLALLLLTPLLSLFGTMAVNRRMAFFSDALGHSALAGVGLGMLLGVQNELISMIVFGVIWAIMISRINRTGGEAADTIISVFSSTGIAVGLLILSQNGSFSKYSSLLAGDVLSISPPDLFWLLLALPLGIGAWALLYNRLLLTAVNPALAQSRGIKTKWVEYAFVSLVAIAVMLSIRWVGVLLINALLILPAAAARNISRTALQHALFSVLIGLLSGVGGLIAAYYLDTGVGAAVVLCAAVCYGITLPLRGRTR
ncbi:MAG: metal ABC transporter permease [Clostridiales bacterium]|nr:metal ABC transporter permease [Clostridiales bacterium]